VIIAARRGRLPTTMRSTDPHQPHRLWHGPTSGSGGTPGWSFPGTDPATVNRAWSYGWKPRCQTPRYAVWRRWGILWRGVAGRLRWKVQLIIRDPQRAVLMGASDPPWRWGGGRDVIMKVYWKGSQARQG